MRTAQVTNGNGKEPGILRRIARSFAEEVAKQRAAAETAVAKLGTGAENRKARREAVLEDALSQVRPLGAGIYHFKLRSDLVPFAEMLAEFLRRNPKLEVTAMCPDGSSGGGHCSLSLDSFVVATKDR